MEYTESRISNFVTHLKQTPDQFTSTELFIFCVFFKEPKYCGSYKMAKANLIQNNLFLIMCQGCSLHTFHLSGFYQSPIRENFTNKKNIIFQSLSVARSNSRVNYPLNSRDPEIQRDPKIQCDPNKLSRKLTNVSSPGQRKSTKDLRGINNLKMCAMLKAGTWTSSARMFLPPPCCPYAASPPHIIPQHRYFNRVGVRIDRSYSSTA